MTASAFAICVAIFLPSGTLLYSMAGVKVGEYVANTDLGRKAVRLIEQRLDEALSGATKQ